MPARSLGNFFKALILLGISALFWLSAEQRAVLVAHLPGPVRAQIQVPQNFMADNLPSAERALEASRGVTAGLIDRSLTPEQRVAALSKLAYESKGLAKEIRALIESEFPEATAQRMDPHSIASYRRDFEIRLRLMALELYRGAELDVSRIRNTTLRWLAEIRQSGGSVEGTINQMTGVGGRTNLVLPPMPEAPVVNVCPSPAELEAVRADFGFVEVDAEGAWRDLDLARCERKLVAAFVLLRELSEKLSSRGPDVFDADILEGNPYAFVRSRIKTVRFETEDTAPNCLNVGVVAFVDPAFPNAIRVCPYAEELPSALMMTYLLVHEARHVEGFPHALCEQGELAGQFSFACDTSYEAGGSYAAGAEFYVKILRAEGVNPELRREARHLALVDFLNRFNELPFGLTKGALLKTVQGKLLFFDGRELVPLLKESPELRGAWRLTLRAGLSTFFDLTDGGVRTWEFETPLAPTPGEFAATFGTELSNAQRKTFKDAYFGFNYACLLFTAELRCGVTGEKDITLKFSRLRPLGFLYSARSSVVPSETLFIVGSGGELYQLPRVFAELNLLTETKLKPVPTKYYLRALTPWLDGFELGVRTDGTAWIYSVDSKKWSKAERLAPYRFETLVGPAYWSPTLELLR